MPCRESYESYMTQQGKQGAPAAVRFPDLHSGPACAQKLTCKFCHQISETYSPHQKTGFWYTKE
eukprot:356459-Chlamydomonas_euryale.AAC.3